MTSRKRRMIRLITPVAVVFALCLVTLVTYEIQQPDRTDPSYLSPSSTADIGGNRLARRLADRGITVQRETKTSEAMAHAASGDATLLIPAPALVHPFYLRMIKLLPASTNVVLVAPDQRALANARLVATVAGSRLATRAAKPGCGFRPAADAGFAGVVRTRYQADQADRVARCYEGALTIVRRGQAEVTLVGADDLFRNDRIGEHHNAELATGLLATKHQVLWLDVHRRESRPGLDDDPDLANQDPAVPSLGGGSPDPDFPIPSGTDDGLGGGFDDGEGGNSSQASNPLWSAFPPWVFATVALLGFAALLFAMASARRMGGPVAEPLPVTVKATETLEGRGRLYQRARARGPAAQTLRVSARRRLAELLGLPADAANDVTGNEEFVATVARQSGWSPEAVTQAIFGPAPADDRELGRVALTIEALLQAVAHQAPPATTPPGGTW